MKIIQHGDVSIKIRNKKSIRRVKVLLNDEAVATLRHHKEEKHMYFSASEAADDFMDDIVKVLRDFSLHFGKTIYFGKYYKEFRIIENVHVSVEGKDYFLPFTKKELQELYNKNGKDFKIINNISGSPFPNHEIFLYGNIPYTVKAAFNFHVRVFFDTNKEHNVCDMSNSSFVFVDKKNLPHSMVNFLSFRNVDENFELEGFSEDHLDNKNLFTLKLPKISVEGCKKYRDMRKATILFDKNVIPDVESFRRVIKDIKDHDYPLSFKFDFSMHSELNSLWDMFDNEEEYLYHDVTEEEIGRERYANEEPPIKKMKRTIGYEDIGYYILKMIEIQEILHDFYKNSSKIMDRELLVETEANLKNYRKYLDCKKFLRIFK